MNKYAVLPLREIVVFPQMIVPLLVGRPCSIKAMEYAISHEQPIILVTQKDFRQDNVKISDMYEIGVIANIHQLLKLSDGSVKVLVEATARVKIEKFYEEDNYFSGEVAILESILEDSVKTEALVRSIRKKFEEYTKLNRKVSAESLALLDNAESADKFSDLVASHLLIKIADKQELLSNLNVDSRLESLLKTLESEIDVIKTENVLNTRVQKQLEEAQKSFYLNEKLKAIQKELGKDTKEDPLSEVKQLEKKINKTKFSKEAKDKALEELKKLKLSNPLSAETAVIRNYLDWLLSLPWEKYSDVKYEIADAEEVLDRDHYAMEKVKERILEFLAVQKRAKSLKGPILCLVGPPGVGKTSLARSIADATGREFVRLSLGGVRDESEIRGHRKTYVGAMPGKIIQLMKKAKTNNPLLLLDEVDKMGTDYRGDPASALLEVLDPEQNKSFVDNFIEVEYDLSQVMFIATANSVHNMPRPLLDRMEIIKLSGYTEDEKVEIAKRHLIPKQMKEHCLVAKEWSITEKATRDLARYYTREAGVRNLEREISNLTRKAVKELMMSKSKKPAAIKITDKNLAKYAGVKKYTMGMIEQQDFVGITNGLAYTEAGGDLLMIEAVTVHGRGKIKATGKLGEVMQESAQAAYSYIRSQAATFGIPPTKFLNCDIHIHAPEGAIPKDGPSAGVAMCTSIVSVMTGIAVKRSVAMTGEITLRGRVLAIGGLKEKLLAALRAGISTVFIPQENAKDLEELPSNIKEKLNIVTVSMVEEVLHQALAEPIKAIDWVEPAILTGVEGTSDDKNDTHFVKH